MSQLASEVLRANSEYATNSGDKGTLQLAPRRRCAILTCMDARVDPARLAGLREGDAHVIRNAGGRASDDAIRSLVISHKLLGTREWFVIHHSNCGMQLFNDETMRRLLASSPETANYDGERWTDRGKGRGSSEAESLTITDQDASVVSDVRRIRQHPLVPRSIPIRGYIYNVETGRLIEVPEASQIGRAD